MYYNRRTSSPKVTINYSHLDRNYHKSNRFHQNCRTQQQGQRYRTGSLPPSKIIPQVQAQSKTHIKIVEESSPSNRIRKHKIFEQQSSIIHKNSASKSRRRSQTIFGQYKRNSRQTSNQRESTSKKNQLQTVQVKIQTDKQPESGQNPKKINQSLQDMSISELNTVIDRRIGERISIIDSRLQSNAKQQIGSAQILQKQQQIICLKLQVQRLKRCENLNKENQSLYKKLVEKLKEHCKKDKSLNTRSPKKQKQPGISPRKHLEKLTPIHSLCDLKKAGLSEHQQSNQQSKTAIIKEPQSSKKVILSPQQLFNLDGQIQTKQSVTITGNSQPMTFNNTKEIAKQRTHSKRLKMQTFPSMNQVKQQILYGDYAKPTCTQNLIEDRLLQINNQLQRRMSYRSSSKHKYETATSASFYTHKTQTCSQFNPTKKMLYY